MACLFEVETFSVALHQAVISARALENPEYDKRRIDMSLLADFLFVLAQNDDPPKYFIVEVIRQTVDYLIGRTPQLERNECMRNLFNLAAEPRRLRFTCLDLWTCDNWKGTPPYRFNFSSSLTAIALVAAVYCGMDSLAETMLEEGIKTNHTFFGTAMSWAAKRNDINLTVLLLRDGVKRHGSLGFKEAGRNGNNAMLNILFNHVESESRYEELYYRDAIRGAVAGEQRGTIHFLIQQAMSRNLLRNAHNDKKNLLIRVYPRPPHFHGDSFMPLCDVILFEASCRGKSEIVRSALDHGASPLAQLRPLDSCQNALIWAAMGGYEDIVRMLLKGMTTKGVLMVRRALSFAVRFGRIQIAQLLLDFASQLDMNIHLPYQIHTAVRCGQIDTVKLLLDYLSPNLAEESKFHADAYSWSVSHGYTSIVGYFDEAGIGSHQHIKSSASKQT